jgi:lysophospholipase L1-like esterase
MRLLSVLLLALPLALPGVGAAAPYEVVLLGDSITQGTSSEPIGPSFATLLADSLGAGFDVTTIGCGGASSRDWSPTSGSSVCGGLPDPNLPANLYPALAAPNLPADLVVIMLGTNDAMGAFEPAPLTSAEYRAAMEQLVTQLLFDGASEVMLATPPPNFVLPSTAPTLFAYAAQIADLCGASGDAVLCGPDVLSLLQFEDFETGQIHPNASGHAKIADAMYASILLAIPEPGTGTMLGIGLVTIARMRRNQLASRSHC